MDNVKAFFERFDSDDGLRERVRAGEAAYPGSLEIREALVTAVLLPEAQALGLGFTLEELLGYEQALWDERHGDDWDGGDDGDGYWLLGYGWSNDEGRFCGDK